jgi:hypothetical protein
VLATYSTTSGLALFVNGIENTMPSTSFTYSDSTDLLLGSVAQGVGAFLDGTIDDVEFYDTVVPSPLPVPTVSLAASPDPDYVAQAATLTTTVGADDDGGTVEFTVAPMNSPSEAVPVSGCSAVALSTSQPYTAVCTTSTLAAGSYDLTAVYSGDSEDAAAGAKTTLVVNKVPTALSATPALLSTSGELYLFSLQATLSTVGEPVVSQPVSFIAGTTSLCANVRTDGEGVATCHILTNVVGVVHILLADGYSVSFGGTSTYAPSNAAAGLIGA